MLETGNAPIPQMKILGMTVDLDPKGHKITCPAFGLCSCPAEYSTMGHIFLDLTSLAYQPKSRERPAHPKRHVSFALTEKSVHPVHSPELDEDDDDKPLVRPDHACVSEDEDNKPLVQLELKTALELVTPPRVRKRRGSPVWRDPSAPVEPDASRNTRERSEEGSILGKNPDGEALRNVINKVLDDRNLRDFQVKHYRTSTCQFKKRTTHLDLPGKVYDIYQHVVKTCPFCNGTKPRPDRTWRSHVLGSWINENWKQNLWIFSLSQMERHHI